MSIAVSNAEENSESIEVVIRDFVSGESVRSPIRASWSVDRVRQEIIRDIELPQTDSENRPQHYELFVRHEDGGRERLNPSSRIGDVVRRGDELEPMPEVRPGRARIS